MRHRSRPVAVETEALEFRRLFAAAPWTALAKVPAARGLTSDLGLKSYRPYTLDLTTIKGSLGKASAEDVTKYGVGQGDRAVLVNIPRPDGSLQRFRVVESAILTGADARKFSTIKTYAGIGVDDPTATVRLDYTPLGFHAQVLTSAGSGSYYVEPYFRNSQTTYASYYGSQARSVATTTGDQDVDVVSHGVAARPRTAARTSAGTSGTAVSLRTYRTAVAATAEYTTYFRPAGSTTAQAIAAGQAAIVTAMNRVTGIYETELGIRLTLVGNNSSLVFTDTNTDGYTNDDPDALLSQNQTKIDTLIGNGNYDLGHIFSTAGGGLAGLAVMGAQGQKAQGETGTNAPVGDAFYVDYVAHEMGHQFGGNHTFNTSQDSNRNFFTAFEPGSGSTIMAYAGIEQNEDLQPNSDPFFSFASLDEILNYVDTGTYSYESATNVKTTETDSSIPSVGTRAATGNSVPTVTFGTTAYTIPANTPFTLTSPTATDANGDTVYYSWEEADSGTAKLLNAADNGSGALFRVYNPVTSPSRTFPILASVLAGQTYTNTPKAAAGTATGRYSERLPTTNRAMKFVLTLRDKKAGGGGTNVYSATPTTVTSVAAASGFAITNLNSAATLAGGSTPTLSWNVAGTTANGINTANVQILMSTDGGQTFPTVLASNTPNDGSEVITLPNVASTQVRFKVAAVGNIFFDISNANLTTTAAVTPTKVTSVAIDTGVQRSRVRGATVLFDGVIPAANIAAGAFTLTQTSGTISPYTVSVASVTNPTASTTAVALTFSGSAVVGGSIADGRYTLSINGNSITGSNGVKVDAAGTGTAASTGTTNFFRLYGDVDGDNGVSINDFNGFAASFGSLNGQANFNTFFDYDGDNGISINDFNEFAGRFGKIV